MKKRVFVTRALPGPALDWMRGFAHVELWPGELPPSAEELRVRVVEADALLCLLTDRVDKGLLECAPRLRVISNYAVGVDNIDLDTATQRGLPVGNTPGVLTETTADLAMALLLAAARRVPEGVDWARAGRWRTWEPGLLLGRDVHGATLGIVGLGRIGQAVCRRAMGFGMSVLYHDPGVLGSPPGLDAQPASLGDLLERSDFVTLHAPLLPSNKGLIGQAALSRMKPDAVLVNTARGDLVDTEALVDHLRRCPDFRAALDVTSPEPLSHTHPLYEFPNCIILPHLGSASVATRHRMAQMAVENVLAGLQGRRLPNCANPMVYGSLSTDDAQ
jgi:lactate dehydrogenase-like 2-hydroxyacid dehydrogenase